MGDLRSPLGERWVNTTVIYKDGNGLQGTTRPPPLPVPNDIVLPLTQVEQNMSRVGRRKRKKGVAIKTSKRRS